MTKTSKITYTRCVCGDCDRTDVFRISAAVLLPPFLKVDLSGAVVLIGAFIFGIAPAITMIALKISST